uniref:Uncharacterized protein LOC116955023 isoform X1 n=1 Tax=Petromyzon marinus TaxID=7757 RepID=A0AAJ7U8K9_PETMA|nr:uncharacterized protein LOC116955023 isoform X1 [Petromyzon marinus]
MAHKQIYYSDKYTDEHFEYRATHSALQAAATKELTAAPAAAIATRPVRPTLFTDSTVRLAAGAWATATREEVEVSEAGTKRASTDSRRPRVSPVPSVARQS